jgi:signal peptidase I
MQLRSGKVVLHKSSSINVNVSGNYDLRGGRVVIRLKTIPKRVYIKRKENIELRSGRLVPHKKYAKRVYIKRKENIELRSGRLVAHKKYAKRAYKKRPVNVQSDAHIKAMLDHYKFNYLAMYSTLLHVTNCDHRKTVDMVRDWQASEQRHAEFMALNNPKNYYNPEW